MKYNVACVENDVDLSIQGDVYHQVKEKTKLAKQTFCGVGWVFIIAIEMVLKGYVLNS